MAKPQKYTNNRLDITKEPGDGEEEGGGEGGMTGKGREGGEGKQEKSTDDTPSILPQRC